MTPTRVFRSVLVALALACQGAPAPTLPSGEQAPADRIYLGEIVTVDAEGSVAEAVAIRGGRILAVGDADDVLGRRGPQTDVVDLQGAALLPGFIDPHSHFLMHGVPFSGFANVSRPPVGAVRSIPDIVAELTALSRRLGARLFRDIPDAGRRRRDLDRDVCATGR